MHRILVVNHDEELLLLLKLEIAELRHDFGVDIARYLPAALELARTRRPGLIVLGVEGWAEGARKAYQRLRNVCGHETRFVLLGQATVLQQYRHLSAVAYLTRPVRLAHLRQALAHAEDHGLVREDVRPAGTSASVH